jgi:hypothetical protein
LRPDLFKPSSCSEPGGFTFQKSRGGCVFENLLVRASFSALAATALGAALQRMLQTAEELGKGIYP